MYLGAEEHKQWCAYRQIFHASRSAPGFVYRSGPANLPVLQATKILVLDCFCALIKGFNPKYALNILRNKSALAIGICTTFTYFQTLRPRKHDFLHETGFSLPHRYHFDGRSSSELKEPRFRLLEIEANAVIYIHFLNNFLNKPGFWCREPRLVM